MIFKIQLLHESTHDDHPPFLSVYKNVWPVKFCSSIKMTNTYLMFTAQLESEFLMRWRWTKNLFPIFFLEKLSQSRERCTNCAPYGLSGNTGAAYVRLLRPSFSAPLSPNDPIFLLKINGSHSMTPYFFFRSPKASKCTISTVNWLFQMILCTINIGASMGLEGPHRKTENHILTKCHHNFGPKCGLTPNEIYELHPKLSYTLLRSTNE